MAIEWEIIIRAYNEEQETKLTEKQVIQLLFDSIGSVRQVADYLGVCYGSLARKMDKLGVRRPIHGFSYNKLVDRIMSIPACRMQHMTSHEIAAEIGCAAGTVRHHCVEVNRKYKGEIKDDHTRS